MSVRMAAPLTLVLLLLIHRVDGAFGFSVSYGSPHICALRDSTVTMSCTYRYPALHFVSRAFWTKTHIHGMFREYPDLSEDPEYSQRVQYLGDKQNNCNLRLSHVTKEDEHEYYFTFTTNIAEWIGIPGVNLSVTDLQVESPVSVTEGDSVRLTCKSSCKLTETPRFFWYRNSQTLTEGSFQNDLVYSSISRGHAGHYSCGVQGHNYISPAVYLDVRYAPGIPVIYISGSAVIVEGDSVSLICSSDSNPSAEINWYKDPPKSVSVSISGSAVIMSGDSVTLNCSSDSNPPAEISWFKGKELVKSGRIFNISKISSDDSGEYKCRARNDHGVKYSDPVTLDVKLHQSTNTSVITATFGGLFIIIIIIIIIIILFIIRRKRTNRRSSPNNYEVT
ncbi:B-cell receptor CD22-like [Danio aesculapii]|uniref:B-cell receptor CD22-like n=1 Tax=Danio aesculapii TaxID=1142201 RepID=UPI0024C08919|nr:B-cell receptor CD22-like [Danio aesculapii]